MTIASLQLAGADFGNEFVAVGTNGIDLAAFDFQLRVVEVGHKRLKELTDVLSIGCGQHVFDLRADQLVFSQPEVDVQILLQLQTMPLSLTESSASVTLSKMASRGVVLVSDWVIVASILS